jgi:hypothetical protein
MPIVTQSQWDAVHAVIATDGKRLVPMRKPRSPPPDLPTKAEQPPD